MCLCGCMWQCPSLCKALAPCRSYVCSRRVCSFGGPVSAEMKEGMFSLLGMHNSDELRFLTQNWAFPEDITKEERLAMLDHDILVDEVRRQQAELAVQCDWSSSHSLCLFSIFFFLSSFGRLRTVVCCG